MEISSSRSEHFFVIFEIIGSIISFDKSELYISFFLSIVTEETISEILIFLLSLASLYPPFGPLEPIRIPFFTSV